jgi:hypothetical protein
VPPSHGNLIGYKTQLRVAHYRVLFNTPVLLSIDAMFQLGVVSIAASCQKELVSTETPEFMAGTTRLNNTTAISQAAISLLSPGKRMHGNQASTVVTGASPTYRPNRRH